MAAEALEMLPASHRLYPAPMRQPPTEHRIQRLTQFEAYYPPDAKSPAAQSGATGLIVKFLLRNLFSRSLQVSGAELSVTAHMMIHIAEL